MALIDKLDIVTINKIKFTKIGTTTYRVYTNDSKQLYLMPVISFEDEYYKQRAIRRINFSQAAIKHQS